MMEDFASINWLAVVVGAILAFAAGWLWYSPRLFGTKWAAGSGVQLGSAGSMPMFALLSQLVAVVMLALVVGMTETFNALITAILIIFTVAVFALSARAFVKKSGNALAVDAGYIIVAGAH
ncbi:MAG: DUF1761 family protein [Caldilineaceae bacterium]